MIRLPAIFCFLLLAWASEAAEKPNVLFLFADDMRADSIAALGNPVVKTPHLDSIVNRGFAFENAFCFGGNSPAVCTPSRNMLLSGNAYFRWKNFTPPGGNPGKKGMGARPGMLAPGDGPNFPLSMQAAGYETYHHGKKGNTAPLIQAKFQHDKYLQNDEAERKSGEPGREIADEATRFIKERDAAKPFFMYLAFGNPHDPRVAAQKYFDLYDGEKIPLPANYLPVHPFNNGDMAVRDEQLSPWPRTEAEIRRTLHEYYATITAMDAHIGRVLNALKESGQMENTLILFSADQGIAVGSHGLLGKQNLYNAGMNSPLFFAGPGIPKGRSDALVYLFDIYPTICDLVGAEVPTTIDGRSFKPVIEGRATGAREELFLSYMQVQRAVIADGYKLIRYPQINRTQLFDFTKDKDETNDLSSDPAQKGRVAALMEKLAKWQKHYTDDLPLTSAKPLPGDWAPPVKGVKQQ
jgi:arylsulfatase A-like enzyme